MPIWAIVHLSTSPTATSRYWNDYLVDGPLTAAIVPSMFLSYMVTAILMALPAPSWISYGTKQNFIAIWQFFPLTAVILQQGFAWAAKLYCPALSTSVVNDDSEKRKRQMSLRALRSAYICAFLFASPIRLATMTMIASSRISPGLFAPEYQGVFDPSTVLIAKAITPSVRMSSLAAGVMLLVQYDEMISAVVLLLWSSVLYLRADASERSAGKWMILIWRCFLVWAVAGPVGVVIFSLWARDELMYARADERDAKDT